MKYKDVVNAIKVEAFDMEDALIFMFACICCPCVAGALVWAAMSDGYIGPKHYTHQVKRQARRERRIRKERLKNEPPPLRSNRRALSVSRPIKANTLTNLRPSFFSSKPTDPPPSAFFSLPLEVREQIYREVLGDGLIHLTQLPKRLGHFRCTHDINRPAGEYQRCLFRDSLRECMEPVPNSDYPDRSTGETIVRCYFGLEPLDRDGKSDCCIALLKICRQVYREATFILYTTNTFDVNHPQTLIFLARTIPLQRLELIQNLQITWHMPSERSLRQPQYPDDFKTWAEMWDIIGTKMKGLQRVKLTMMVTSRLRREFHGRDSLVNELIVKMLLEPSQKVRGLEDFQLDVQNRMNQDGEFATETLREMMRDTILEA